jgi:putative endonuclease
MNYYVYITANKNNNVIYIGVTNNIERRIYEHKSGEIKGFTQKYNVHKLVYVEMYSNIDDAIKREKQLKGWSRSKKNILIETTNPDWNELMC